jgi:hypothetical protein
MSGTIPNRDQKVLCTRSGNRCAMPECRKVLVVDKTENDRESLVAQMAHIKGEKPAAPRYDANMTELEKNSCNNLILVCDNCHKVIDDQPNTYTVEKLYEIKCQHEKWVIESTEKEIINITFAELSVVTKYLISGQFVSSDSLTIIPPKEKIKKNELSSSVEQLITMGMIQVRQVDNFISKCPDLEFGERLREGFVAEYERLKNKEGLKGDDLFDALHDFASGKSNDFKNKAAGLAVLVYLFEKCEVFEK